MELRFSSNLNHIVSDESFAFEMVTLSAARYAEDGTGRCEADALEFDSVPDGFYQDDGSYISTVLSREGNVLFPSRITLAECKSKCHEIPQCQFISWKDRNQTGAGEAWCYISVSCQNQPSTPSGGDDHQDLSLIHI